MSQGISRLILLSLVFFLRSVLDGFSPLLRSFVVLATTFSAGTAWSDAWCVILHRKYFLLQGATPLPFLLHFLLLSPLTLSTLRLSRGIRLCRCAGGVPPLSVTFGVLSPLVAFFMLPQSDIGGLRCRFFLLALRRMTVHCSVHLLVSSLLIHLTDLWRICVGNSLCSPYWFGFSSS